MLLPKRVKYRRQHRPETTSRSRGGNFMTFDEYGLQTTTISQIISRQIGSVRIAIIRYMKHSGKVWIKIFPHTPYTKKPLEVHMDAGKGTVEGRVAVVKPGHILFEIAGVSEDVAREALRLASRKLPVKTRLMRREELGDETNEG